MDNLNYIQTLEDIERNIEAINALSNQLVGFDFFKPNQFSISSTHSPELCFYKTVAYSYVLFRESGKSVDYFLKNRKGNYPGSKTYTDDVSLLRTFLFHRMEDKRISKVEAFFDKRCNKKKPENEDDWEKCCAYILNNLNEIVKKSNEICEEINNDPEKAKDTIAQWQRLVHREHTSYETEMVFNTIKKELGLDNLQFKDLYNKEEKDLNEKEKIHESISNKIKLLDDGYNFEQEARKVIEPILLKYKACPLTLDDLDFIADEKDRIDILFKSHIYYESNSCSKEDLLEAIKNRIKFDCNFDYK
jgi:hypothetical protein